MSATDAVTELLAGTTLDAGRPFSAPWEARAFAIAVRMRELGLCTWDEFRRLLIAEIGKADKAHAHGWLDPGDGYYTHFCTRWKTSCARKASSTTARWPPRCASSANPAERENFTSGFEPPSPVQTCPTRLPVVEKPSLRSRP